MAIPVRALLQILSHQILWAPHQLLCCPYHFSKQFSLPTRVSMVVKGCPPARIPEACGQGELLLVISTHPFLWSHWDQERVPVHDNHMQGSKLPPPSARLLCLSFAHSWCLPSEDLLEMLQSSWFLCGNYSTGLDLVSHLAL